MEHMCTGFWTHLSAFQTDPVLKFLTRVFPKLTKGIYITDYARLHFFFLNLSLFLVQLSWIGAIYLFLNPNFFSVDNGSTLNIQPW